MGLLKWLINSMKKLKDLIKKEYTAQVHLDPKILLHIGMTKKINVGMVLYILIRTRPGI